MVKLNILIGMIFMLVSCADTKIEGHWVQPIPGMAGQVQGIDLQEGGKASSINMSTLVYEAWRKEGDRLILSGKSIGNGQTIEFVESYRIVDLTADKLVLKNGETELAFIRTAEIE